MELQKTLHFETEDSDERKLQFDPRPKPKLYSPTRKCLRHMTPLSESFEDQEESEQEAEPFEVEPEVEPEERVIEVDEGR